jgi:hypothetical protein
VAVIHQSGLAAVYVLQESSFCTIDGTLGNFTPVPAVWENATSVSLEEPTEDPGHVGQRLDQNALGVLMPKKASYPLIVPIETFTTKATSGVQAPLHWLGKILGPMMGGIYRSTGTVITGSSSTTSVLAVTDASTHRPGGCVALLNPTTLLWEAREIASVDTAPTPDTITLKMALSFTPAAADVVRGSASCFLHNNPNGVAPTFLQWLMFGYNKYERFQLPGGTTAGLKVLNMQPGGFPRFDLGLQMPTWLRADGTNGTVSSEGTDLALVTYSDTVANTVRDSDCRLRAHGSAVLATSTLVQATELNIEPNIVYEQLASPNGPFSGNVRGAIRKDSRGQGTCACKVTFLEPAEDNKKYHTAHTARTLYAFTQQVGMTTAGGFMISVPTMQTMEPGPKYENLGAARGVRVPLSSMLDAETPTEATLIAASYSAADIALAKAAMRIHFF